MADIAGARRRVATVWVLVVCLTAAGVAGAPVGTNAGGPALAAVPPDAQVQPAVPKNSGWGRRIVYDRSRQRVWLVDQENLTRSTYLVSGHLYGTLPAVGNYRVRSKSRYTSSLDGSVSMEYMVRFVYGNTRWIGFHSIPRDGAGRLIQPLSKLGTPQSSGCIRQALSDARRLYRFAPVGTRVVVIR